MRGVASKLYCATYEIFPPAFGGNMRQYSEAEMRAIVWPEVAKETGADSTEDEEKSNAAVATARNVNLTIVELSLKKNEED